MTNHSLHIQLKENHQKLTLLQSQLRKVLGDIRDIEKLTQNKNTRQCESCNKEFVTTDKRKIYCDFECSKKGQIMTKCCKYCNTTFTTTNKKKIYCNIECTLNAQHEGIKKAQIVTKCCTYCNKEFQTNLELREYCDMSCQKRAKAKRMYAKKKKLYNILKQVLDK